METLCELWLYLDKILLNLKVQDFIKVWLKLEQNFKKNWSEMIKNFTEAYPELNLSFYQKVGEIILPLCAVEVTCFPYIAIHSWYLYYPLKKVLSKNYCLQLPNIMALSSKS